MAPRWVVASGVGVAQMLAFGTSLYLLTVLAQPMKADTGWPLEWIIGGMSLGALAGAAVAPGVGRWIKRHGGRPALSLSSFLFAGGLSILSVSPNLGVYFLGWIVLGFGMACGLYDTAFGALGRLYGLEARRAITTVTLWGGLASTVFWSLSGLLVIEVGWRGTCAIFAAMHLLIALPIYRFLLPAAEPHVEAPGAAGEAASVSRLSDLARAAMIALGVVLMAETVVASIISVHLITLLRERGLTLAAAIAVGVFIGPTQVSARFGESLLGHRYHPSLTMLLAVGAITLGVGLLPFVPTRFAVVPLMGYGAGIGLVSVARGALPLYLFGPLEAPVVSGRIGRPVAIVQALAPSGGAFLISRIGGAETLWLLTGVGLLSVAAAVVLRRLAGRMGAVG